MVKFEGKLVVTPIAIFSNRLVKHGRITVPYEDRRKDGIEDGLMVTFVVVERKEGEMIDVDPMTFFSRKIKNGRVTVPLAVREKAKLNEGDLITLAVISKEKFHEK